MKKILVLTLICFIQITFSQILKENKDSKIPSSELFTSNEVIKDKNHIYNISAIDTKPEFPEGNTFMYAFIDRNLNNPQELKGKVYASFVVEKDGSLSDIKIIRDVGFETKEEAISIKEEAIRVLKLSPKWIPGKIRSKKVRTLVIIPIFID
ncbi:energy transducer TonB [Flavobacterium sp. SH_e]|uniref:energy transducer TonB n=1 Tax=Flavobacterium TaxID=237 RepID=UPI0021E47DB2|nr:energy transducer TonB [Flavobacterium sp. SH_e]MCV2483845.1 energy transducer TonB [Flavobacterium sp. SH_e]